MTEAIGPFAYNIPFFSIFLALLAAIVTPLLPRGSRAAERLTLAVVEGRYLSEMSAMAHCAAYIWV